MSEELVPLVFMESSEGAGMLRELLENQGIATVVSGALDPIIGTVPALGVRVSVRAADLERAREIYQAYFGATEEKFEEEGFGPEED